MGEDDESYDLGDFEDYDPGPGLLTSGQREYLRGSSDIEPKSARERSIRARIRSRLSGGLWDMNRLWRGMERRDLAEAIDATSSNQLPSCVSLILDGGFRASEHDLDEDEVANEDMFEFFETLLGASLEMVFRSRGVTVEDVDVSVDVEFGQTVEEMAEGRLEDLSVDELVMVFQKGEISPEEMTAALKAHENVRVEGDVWIPEDPDSEE